jgi:hypothetical protein
MAAGVLRKGGGLAEALKAAEQAAAGGTPARQQHPGQIPGQTSGQTSGQTLAGDWQGAESGLSDIELELLLAEFSYVEQVVVLGESLLHHLPGQEQLAARLLSNLLQGVGSSSSSGGTAAAAADRIRPNKPSAAEDKLLAIDVEGSVMGLGSLLSAAVLSQHERAGLLHWVAACRGHQLGLKGCSSSSSDGSEGLLSQQQKQQYFGYLHQDSEYAGGVGAVAAAAAAQHAEDTALQQQGEQQGSSSIAEGFGSSNGNSNCAAEIRQLQRYLGDTAQREWVLTCGRHPAAAAAAGSPAALATSEAISSSGSGGVRLNSAVAAAVAAATGGKGSAAAAAAGGSVQPPSRMYLQEADGEMRMALVLVSVQGQ